jgi:hypothetical protein
MSKKDGVIEDDFDFVIRQREIKNRDREKYQKNLKELLLSIKLFDKIDDDTVEKNE